MWRAAVALAILVGSLTFASVGSPHKAHSATSAECTGEYRWDIKTLSDDYADQVNLQPVNAGVADFWDEKKPAAFKSKFRTPGLEMTTYRVKANLVEARWVNEAPTATKKGGDLDIHLVIAALTNKSKTMVVEFPFKDCVAAVPLLKKRMIRARNAFIRNARAANREESSIT
jgi:hypothetical protein